MKMEELKDEEMYVLVAPDGSVQLSTMAPDFAMCLAMTKLLGESGIGQSIEKLFDEGYHILPVKVTITQNGDENTAFQKAVKDVNGE